jgi:copper chaperone CopZ
MIKITIEVEGMKCPMCEAHTNEAVKQSLAVSDVSSSHKENKTTILTDIDIPDEKIREVIAKTGYTVGDISREEVKKKGFFARFKR